MDIKQHVYKRFALILNDGFLVSITNKIRGSISWGIIKNIPKIYTKDNLKEYKSSKESDING